MDPNQVHQKVTDFTKRQRNVMELVDKKGGTVEEQQMAEMSQTDTDGDTDQGHHEATDFMKTISKMAELVENGGTVEVQEMVETEEDDSDIDTDQVFQTVTYSTEREKNMTKLMDKSGGTVEVQQMGETGQTNTFWRKRRSNWSEEETSILLSIWSEPEIRRKISLKTNKKKSVWAEIAARFHILGFPEINAEQVFRKVKELKRRPKKMTGLIDQCGGNVEVEEIVDIQCQTDTDIDPDQVQQKVTDLPNKQKKMMELLDQSRGTFEVQQISGTQQTDSDIDTDQVHQKALDLTKKQKNMTELVGKSEGTVAVQQMTETGQTNQFWRKRRHNWSEEETSILMSIWSEPEICEQISLKTNKKKSVWAEIAARFHILGFPEINAEQVFHKVKDTKRKHKKMTELMDQSGGIVEVQEIVDTQCQTDTDIDPDQAHQMVTDLTNKQKKMMELLDQSRGTFEVQQMAGIQQTDSDIDTDQVYDDVTDFTEKQKTEMDESGEPVEMQQKMDTQQIDTDIDTYQVHHDGTNFMMKPKMMTEVMDESGGTVEVQQMAASEQSYKLCRKRRRNWSDEETSLLMSIWNEPEIHGKISVKTNQKKSVWAEIAARFHILGFRGINAEHVFHKVKDIKRRYKKMTGLTDQSGGAEEVQQMTETRQADDRQARSCHYWSNERTRNLISIWKEPQILQQIFQKTNVKKTVWEEMATRLQSLGFTDIEPDQVQQKVKLLKKKYKMNEMMDQGGGTAEVQHMMNSQQTDTDSTCDQMHCDVADFREKQKKMTELLDEIEQTVKLQQMQERRYAQLTVHWTNEKIKQLISIWKEPKILEQISLQKTNKKKHVWLEISERLHSMGYTDIHSDTVRVKVLELKNKHKKMMELIDSSGGNTDVEQLFPFFYHVHPLITGERPADDPLPGHCGDSSTIKKEVEGKLVLEYINPLFREDFDFAITQISHRPQPAYPRD